MSTTDFVVIPPWDDEEAAPFTIGTRVRHHEIPWPNHPEGRNPNGGRVGTVVAWGRGLTSDAHWRSEHEPVLKCTYGTECDALVDSEGPVVRWDDQDPGDESLDWYPGQAMGVIEAIPPDTIPREGVIQDVMRVDRMHRDGIA